MADPKKSNEVANSQDAGEEGHDLMLRVMRHMKEASEAPLSATPLAAGPTTSLWDVEAFKEALEQVSRRTDAYRKAWAKVDSELTAVTGAAKAVESEATNAASGITEARGAAVRLLTGFKARLEDLIKGWSLASQGPGVGSLSLAGARSLDRGESSGKGSTAGAPHPTLAIVKARWSPNLGCLILDWAEDAHTGPLKESAAVDAFVEQAGQRRRVPAAFRRSSRDGSVNVDIVAVELTQADQAAREGAEVEVAWMSDEEGTTQRLVVVFRISG